MTFSKITLKVEGMTCNSCAVLVRRALQAAAHTSCVDVDMKDGVATLEYPSEGDMSQLIEAVSKGAEKKASLLKSEAKGIQKVTLRVEGMTCMSCVEVVRQALENGGGAKDVQIWLESGIATMEYPEGRDESVLVEVIKKDAGKQAIVVHDGPAHFKDKTKAL